MDYWLSFLAGLFGSMHCVGMCGAIVLGYSTQGLDENATTVSSMASHLTYNAGRVLSYTLVGGFLGLVGGGISGLHEIGYWFSLLMGITLTLLGISQLRLIPRLSIASELRFGQQTRNILFRLYQATFGKLIAQRTIESKFYIGLMTPLLPCGLLYSMFLKAASSATIVGGAVTMLFFGLGIVPALVITGFASSYFGYRLRVWGDKIAAVTIIVMGLSLLLRALKVDVLLMGGHHH